MTTPQITQYSPFKRSGTAIQTKVAGDDLEIDKVTASNDVLITNSAKGIVLKDAANPAHYWRITVDVTGALVTTDLGTNPP